MAADTLISGGAGEPPDDRAGRDKRALAVLVNMATEHDAVAFLPAALPAAGRGTDAAPGARGRHRRARGTGTLSRLADFSAIGALVFAAGTALQWLLLRDGVTSDASYALQTAFSILLSFFCNWKITWSDRHAPLWPSLAKWCLQKGLLNILNVGLYAWLEHRGLSWLTANVIATAVFTLVNYLGGDLWAFRAVRVSIPGCLAAAVILGIPAALALVPALRPLVYVAWLAPWAEVALLVTGAAWYRHRFREAPAGTFTELIIQITTAGNEPERVSEIIGQIRGYHLDMPHRIWAVTEPHDLTEYPADLVLRVPASFAVQSRRKARALEYSRRVRDLMDLSRPDVKIVFNDDDVTLTRAYIETAFRADYDVCEGVITPRTRYAVRPFSHFLASHADDIRTHACLIYCSTFQGIFRRPVHVHGEGMVTTGAAERVITWDWPVIASEDLVFGQRAVKAGLRWGWFHEYAEVTSPWSLREYLIQRQRWLWGDIHAIRHRSVMPAGAAFRVTFKYAEGVLALSCSAVGLWLRMTGRIPSTAGILNFGKLSLMAWVGVFFTCGWIAAGSAVERRSHDSRMLSGVLAVLLMPVSALLTVAAVVIPLVQGDPGDFKTIRKTR